MVDYEYSNLFQQSSVDKQLIIETDDKTVKITNNEFHKQIKENNMSKKLLDNGMVEETIVKEIPRYEGICNYSQAECEMIAEVFKETNKVWTMKHNREGFDSLDTGEDWEPEGNSVCEDIESFQKYLDETYGKDKYEAYRTPNPSPAA